MLVDINAFDLAKEWGGILLKIAYASLVFWYHFTTGIPPIWMWRAYIDTAFLILYLVAQRNRVATVRGG